MFWRTRDLNTESNHTSSLIVSFPHTVKKSHYPPGILTTMLATSVNVLFTGHNNLLTTYTDDPSL